LSEARFTQKVDICETGDKDNKYFTHNPQNTMGKFLKILKNLFSKNDELPDNSNSEKDNDANTTSDDGQEAGTNADGELDASADGQNGADDSDEKDAGDEKGENDKGGGGGIDFDALTKKSFVRLESAYRHQHVVFRRSTEDNRITLGEILDEMFDVKRETLTSLAVVSRSMRSEEPPTETVINDAEAIWHFDLFGCVLRDKGEDGYYTMGMSTETVLIVKSSARCVLLSIISLGGVDAIKYMRVTVLAPDNSALDDGHSFENNSRAKSDNAPTVASFILSNKEVDDNADLDYYEQVERSARAKVASREENGECDEIEEEYFNGINEFRYSYYYGYGKFLFGQKRYYDAFVMLERAYYDLKQRIAVDDFYLPYYHDTCRVMGTCLMLLKRFDEAAYYCKQAAHHSPSVNANDMAVCLAQLGNPVAVQHVREWQMVVVQQHGGDEQWEQEVRELGADVRAMLRLHKEVMDDFYTSFPRYEEKVTLGFVLDMMFMTRQQHMQLPISVYDAATNRFLERIDDREAASNFVLNEKGAADKVLVLSCSHAHYQCEEEVDQSILCVSAPMVIATHSIINKEGAATLRVDIFQSNCCYNDDKRKPEPMNMPLYATFCLGHASGLHFTTYKDSLLEAVRKAMNYMDEKRFMEAYKLAKWVHECCLHQMTSDDGTSFATQDDLLWAIFFEATYVVGFCLMEMGKAQTAGYYLELASHSHNYKHIQEYINFLSNTMDHNALEVVEDVLAKSPKPQEEEQVVAWNYHMAFLKRRKAYILIDKKRYREARQFLMEMRNDPLCKDFAENELHYLDCMEQERNHGGS